MTLAETPKVAMITGGASGIGLAVATALVRRGDWHVHLLDVNGISGLKAAKDLAGAATFHEVDVTAYSEIARMFDNIFRAEGRLDFVFANAGILERLDFYEQHPAGNPPPEVNMRVVDINLKAVYTTSYLVLHYFRQCPSSDRSLVLTASCGGLYACPNRPMYSGTKHGVVGFMRSIASTYVDSGIRVNAICPGTVETSLLADAEWRAFPQNYFTPISVIVDTVLKLIDGGTVTDAKGDVVEGGRVFGKAVEIILNNFYLRDQHEYCDEAMAASMGADTLEESKPA